MSRNYRLFLTALFVLNALPSVLAIAFSSPNPGGIWSTPDSALHYKIAQWMLVPLVASLAAIIALLRNTSWAIKAAYVAIATQIAFFFVADYMYAHYSAYQLEGQFDWISLSPLLISPLILPIPGPILLLVATIIGQHFSKAAGSAKVT